MLFSLGEAAHFDRSCTRGTSYSMNRQTAVGRRGRTAGCVRGQGDRLGDHEGLPERSWTPAGLFGRVPVRVRCMWAAVQTT